jgi:outer membrane lipoprotein-sorting protein
MKSADEMKKFFKNAAINTNPKMDEAVLNKVFIAHEKITNTRLAKIEPNIRRIIMKSPIIKIAFAAVIIAVVVLGLVELIDTASTSSVALAEVAQKVQASRGVTYRSRTIRSWKSDEPDYEMNYISNLKSRIDSYKANQIFKTIYSNINTKIDVLVDHNHKSYVKMTFEDMEQDDLWTNPKSMVQRFLSHKHSELGEKTIEGVLCEGIETTDPAFFGPDPLLDSLMARVWVGVETGYPVQFEVKIVRKNGEIRIEGIANQFQWDVEFDESMFEPDIPSGYIDISP